MRLVASLLVAATAFGTTRADAQPNTETPLLQDDLASNRRTKIDAPKDDLDAGLDAVMGAPQGFSTGQLDKIEDRIRAELKRIRPGATPRLIVFLYPGRISAEKLKTMSEVFVDVELVMDPCDRNVCRDAVAKHIELVGRSIAKPSIAGAGFKITFKDLTLKTSTQMHEQEVTVYKVPIADCIAAGATEGGGTAWLASQDHAEADYEPIVTKAIARRASEKRVALIGPPSVKRSGNDVSVSMKVKGDRNRVQQQVIDALAAAQKGLGDNPKSPPSAQLEVVAAIEMHGTQERRFRSPGNPVGLYLGGSMSGGDLWANYVEEVKKEAGAVHMGFDDAEAAGHDAAQGDIGAGEPDDNEVIALLASNFTKLGQCARAEAERNPSFHGVTVTFQWLPTGSASDVHPKEPALKASPIAGCLRSAIAMIRLPRFSGGPRTIEYPIRVK